MNKKIAIIGAGGHGKVVGEIALLNQFEIIDFFDDKEKELLAVLSVGIDIKPKDLRS